MKRTNQKRATPATRADIDRLTDTERVLSIFRSCLADGEQYVPGHVLLARVLFLEEENYVYRDDDRQYALDRLNDTIGALIARDDVLSYGDDDMPVFSLRRAAATTFALAIPLADLVTRHNEYAARLNRPPIAIDGVGSGGRVLSRLADMMLDVGDLSVSPDAPHEMVQLEAAGLVHIERGDDWPQALDVLDDASRCASATLAKQRAALNDRARN